MATMITFNELRRIKDMLPDGSMQKIADDLHLDVETVRNYFGGDDYDEGTSVGYHFEQGPDGGVVELDDATILDRARSMIPHY
ncbi:MAG: DNA-binding protein [Marinifilaceae bacterium]